MGGILITDGGGIRCLQYGICLTFLTFIVLMPASSVAIRRNSLSLVHWFLSHGASAHLECTPHKSDTPLTYAVKYGSIEIVRLLVSHGARVDHGNLLHAACESSHPGRLEILAFLLERGAPINVLKEAHNTERLRILPCIFRRGTPLHEAIMYRRRAICAALLVHGADPEVRDTKGKTSIEFAREIGFDDMLEILEGRGAKEAG
jgi:ankyrin repeat protein